ncbi:MAG: 5'-methylthioadenosine/adenosylhomocysteine nucleosidase [Parasporobacterium sp.]|nr:5'-methylthioadenosine/adenosylhomocysteine nucleosidase [Parasporobacterium sp.]
MKEQKSVQVTGIIGAMPEEVETLKHAMQTEEIIKIAEMEFCKGLLEGKPAVVVQCGIGKVNAGICVQILRSCFGVTRVINTGVAGSLDNRIEIGDLVVSTDAVQHDYDVSPIGFRKGEIPYTGLVAFQADEKMRALAVEAACSGAAAHSKDPACSGEAAHFKEASHSGTPAIQVFEGRVCSGDQFIASSEQKQRILEEFGGLCCEMEGAAIAQACYLNGIAFVIIRAISDKADDSEEVSYQEFEQAAARRCSEIVRSMISSLD